MALLSTFGLIFFGVVTVVQLYHARIDVLRKQKSNIRQALFLYNIAPGRSRFGIFNSPDELGLGIIAALSFMYVGAHKTALEQNTINQRLYPGSEVLYTSSASVALSAGRLSDAENYLAIAKTVHDSEVTAIPEHLKVANIERLVTQFSVDSARMGQLDLGSAWDGLTTYQKLLTISAKAALLMFGVSMLSFATYIMLSAVA